MANEQIFWVKIKNDYDGYMLVNEQEKTFYKVEDEKQIELLSRLYVHRVHDMARFIELTQDKREAKTLAQFDGSEAII